MKERYVFLDFMKVFSIFSVCFYHYNNLNIDILNHSSVLTYFNYFMKGIASTGVPLFFMVNGVLMLNRTYSLRKLIIRILKIILIVLIWGILTLLLLMIIEGRQYSPLSFVRALWHWEVNTVNHLWFLQTLVCIYMIFPVLKLIYDQEDKMIRLYFLGLLFLFTFGNVLIYMIVNIGEFMIGVNFLKKPEFNFFNQFNPFRGLRAYSVIYFMSGALILRNLKENPKIHSKRWIFLIIVGLILLGFYGIIMSHSNQALFDTVFRGYDSMMTLGMTIGIFILSYLGRYSLNSFASVLTLIGQNTLGIFLVHRMVGSYLKRYFVHWILSSYLVTNLCFAAIVMAVSLGIVLLLKRIPVINLLFQI